MVAAISGEPLSLSVSRIDVETFGDSTVGKGQALERGLQAVCDKAAVSTVWQV